MRLRTTLIVLLIGVAAWLGIRLLGQEKQPAETHPPLVAKDYLDHWDEIELKLFSGERLKLVREPGAVMLRFGQQGVGKDPFIYRDPADPARVEALLGALIQSRRESLQGSADDLLRMGLDPPRCFFIVRAKGLPDLNVGLGNDDPTGSGILARSVGEGAVFRTSGQVMSVLKSFNQDDWRSRTVFGFDPIGVTEIAITHFDPKEPAKNRYLHARRESVREWRLKQPRSLMADAQACQSLAQQISLIRVQNFISQKWDESVTKITGLPDQPFLQVTVASGAAALTLDVGNFVANRGYAAVLHERGLDVCFTLKKEEIEALGAVTADSLRPHRLFPRIENLLVGLKSSAPDGKTNWAFGRQADSPRGRWEVREPFHALAHEGKGSGCFAQTVVDLDGVEVDEFLDPATPFTPEALLELAWRNDQVAERRILAVAHAGDRTLVRVLEPPRPDELFSAKGKLAEILALDPELFRDRAIFPGDKGFEARVVHWKLTAGEKFAVEVGKPDLKLTPVAMNGTPDAMVSKLPPAATALFGAPCDGYVRTKEVPGEPFAKEVLRLTIGTKDGEETLIVGGAGANDDFYCRVTPRLPDDVLMIVKRATLKDLLLLIP